MLILAHLLRRIFVHSGTLIAFVALNSFAGDVVPFNKNTGLKCQPQFQSTSPTTADQELTSRIIKKGEIEGLLFDLIGKSSEIAKRNSLQKEQEQLEQEINELIKTNPAEAANSLLKLVSSELIDHRTRMQASDQLRKITLSIQQIDQLEKEVLKTYKSSELLTNRKTVLDRHNKNLEEIAKDDPLALFRPFIGEDIGANTKVFAHLMRSYIYAVHSLSSHEARPRILFIENLIARILRDMHFSKNPMHSHTQIQGILSNLALARNPTIIIATESMISSYLTKYPEFKIQLVSQIDYHRRSNNLGPLSFDIINTKDLDEAIKTLFEKIESGNTNTFTQRFIITDMVKKLLETGKIDFNGADGPIAQIEKMMERSLHFKHALRLQERELIHAYLFTFREQGKFNPKQSQVIYTLIQKLISDAVQDGKASEPDLLIRDSITIAKVHAIPNIALMQKFAGNEALGTSIKGWIEEYLESMQ